MRLPLGRPLPYRRYPFVQAVRVNGLGTVPRHCLEENVSAQRAPLIPGFDALRSSGFDPDQVHPLLRGFYENDEPHQMRVEWLHWEPWATPLALAYVPLARRLGNLCVPAEIDADARMSSAVQHLDLPDGGSSRRWIRTLSGTCQTFYVAALRTWVDPERCATYWSLAFPYPGMHLMVLLQVRNQGDGIVVSSRDGGLAGTYAVLPGRHRFVALPGPPTHETLSFWVEGGCVVGQHEDFIAGRRTFAMRYRIEL